MSIDFREAEAIVEQHLRLYYEILKELRIENRERSTPTVGSSLGGQGSGSRGPGNPTLSQVLKAMGPVKQIEIPVRIAMQPIGNNRLRQVRLPGYVVKRPTIWLLLIRRIQDLFEGLPGEQVLEEYFFKQQSLRDAAALLGRTRASVLADVKRIVYVAVGLAIAGELV